MSAASIVIRAMAWAVFALVWGVAASAQLENSAFRAGRWDGAAYAGSGGAFSHCAAISSQQKSTLLLVSEDPNGALYIGFMRPTWALRAGESYHVSVFVDGAELGVHQAAVASKSSIRLGPLSQHQVAALRVGRELKLEAGKDVIVASLEDEREMMDAIARCVARFRSVAYRRETSAAPSNSRPTADGQSIPLKAAGGTFVVPVLINDSMTLDFTLDSGAADVEIPVDVFSTLRRTDTVSASDLLSPGVYVLADGSKRREPRFRIRSLRVGNLELHDVVALVGPVEGSLLLGQSFLSRLQTWSIDNQRHVLVINARADSIAPREVPETAEHRSDGYRDDPAEMGRLAGQQTVHDRAAGYADDPAEMGRLAGQDAVRQHQAGSTPH